MQMHYVILSLQHQWFGDSVNSTCHHDNGGMKVLKSQYETTNQTWIQNLKNQLANEKLLESKTGEKFITWVKNMHDQMTATGISITRKDLEHRCIRILPPKYDGLVMALNTQNTNPPLTFQDFSAMLLEEKMCQKTRT